MSQMEREVLSLKGKDQISVSQSTHPCCLRLQSAASRYLIEIKIKIEYNTDQICEPAANADWTKQEKETEIKFSYPHLFSTGWRFAI